MTRCSVGKVLERNDLERNDLERNDLEQSVRRADG
jgi:hypothetical protein